MARYMVNPGCIDEGFRPKNPSLVLAGYMVKPEEALVDFCCESHILAWNMA